MDRIFIIGRDEIPESVRLSEGESFSAVFVALPSVLRTEERRDVRMEIDIDGPGCEVDLAGLYLCRESGELNISINLRHNSGGSVSRQLFKGIAGGNSRVKFDGLIYVAHDAQKTRAYQENHNILLTSEAVVETRPQLEIYADDVECSHGATSGFLNEEELFYMRSRGIPQLQARRLQMISFLAPIAERLPEEIKEKVYEELSES